MESMQNMKVENFSDYVVKKTYTSRGNGWTHTVTSYTITEKDFLRVKELIEKNMD